MLGAGLCVMEASFLARSGPSTWIALREVNCSSNGGNILMGLSHAITSGGLHFVVPGPWDMLLRDKAWADMNSWDRQVEE